MQIGDLIPWNRNHKDATRHEQNPDQSIVDLQRHINRVFDDFWTRFGQTFDAGPIMPSAHPRTDLSETRDSVEVSIELPGMDENDIDVSLSEDALTIQGDKEITQEQSKQDHYLAERTYGAFCRSIALPPGVDVDNAAAQYRNGVLTVTLPKTAGAQEKRRRIEVKGG